MGERTIPRYDLDQVATFVSSMYEALGVPDHRCALATENLLSADLYGLDSHGVNRMRYYVDRIRKGLIDVDASLSVVRGGPSTLVLDANNGLAQVLAPEAMDMTIEKAAESGLAMTSVRKSNHFGIAGYYVRRATSRGFGAISMTISAPLVLPTFGSQPAIGTNPIAFGVPTSDGPPIVVDMSTSVVAYGKLENAKRDKAPIPWGWATDSDGTVTTDSAAAEHLMPLGGLRETGGQKGYGLAVMVDILCAALSGGDWSGALTENQRKDQISNVSHAFLAFNVEAFRGSDEFATSIQELTNGLRSTPVMPDSAEPAVMIPGDPEAAAAARNLRDGIPIRDDVLRELEGIATTLNVDFSLPSARR